MLTQAESVPIKGQGKDKDKDKERVVAETPAEIAKVVTPKSVVVDDTGMDDSGKSTGEPTSGPTFESIAPKESSRNKKKIVEKKIIEPSYACLRSHIDNAHGRAHVFWRAVAHSRAGIEDR